MLKHAQFFSDLIDPNTPQNLPSEPHFGRFIGANTWRAGKCRRFPYHRDAISRHGQLHTDVIYITIT